MHTPAQTPAADGERPHYGRLALLSWFHFLNDGAANYLPGILPALLAALAMDTHKAGLIMSALLVGQALQVFSGWLADHIGGRTLIVLGLLGSSIGAALIGLADSLAWLIPALVAIGVSNALFHPQALAGARQLSRSRPGFGMALFLVGGEVGRGLWPLIASLVVAGFGLHALWVLALPGLASLLLGSRALPHQPSARAAGAPRVHWRRHLGPMAVLVIFALMRALAIFGAVTYLPVLWHEQGRPLVDGAGAIAVMLVVGIIGNVGGGHLADRIGRRAVLVGSSLACALLFVLFLHSAGIWVWPVLGLLGIALFAALPLGILIGQDLVPENRSLGSGVALGLSNGLAAVALIGLDPLAASLGVPAVFWLLAGASLLATAIAALMPVRAATQAR